MLNLLEYANETGRNHFITTSIEHKSVLEAMKHLEKHGCVVDFVAPDETGRIKPQQIFELVTDKTLLVSLMHVNNCGTIVTGYKNAQGDIKVECIRCHVVMVRKIKGHRHDTIDLYAPKGQERLASI